MVFFNVFNPQYYSLNQNRQQNIILIQMQNIKTQVDKNSEQWNTVDYRLQLVLGLPAAHPLKVYKFTNSRDQIRELYQNYGNKTILDSCMNITSLQEQRQKKIYYKKVRMDQIEFETGHLQIDVMNERQRKFTIWMLKLAVGNSYCVPSGEGKHDFIIPQKYDSIYLVNSRQLQQLYNHNYKLKSSDQYVVEYEVVFELEKNKEFDHRSEICNKCEKRSAVAYCKQQQAFFCSECNILHHKQKLLSNHTRQQINRFNTMPLCQQKQHNRRFQIYCFDCKRFLCVQCTLVGDHSGPQNSKHNLKHLKRFYQEKSQLNNELSRNQKQELASSLKKIQQIMKEVEEHSALTEKKIIDLYESSLRELKRLTREKIDEILVLQVETKRQYDQCVWTDSFIKYQQQILKPNHYLNAQYNYEQFKKQMAKNKILRNLSGFKSNNIQLQGQIRVFLQSQNMSNAQVQKNKKIFRSDNIENTAGKNSLSQFKFVETKQDQKQINYIPIKEETELEDLDVIVSKKKVFKASEKNTPEKTQPQIIPRYQSSKAEKKNTATILQSSLKKKGFLLT